jgi:hypothetical protein
VISGGQSQIGRFYRTARPHARRLHGRHRGRRPHDRPSTASPPTWADGHAGRLRGGPRRGAGRAPPRGRVVHWRH